MKIIKIFSLLTLVAAIVFLPAVAVGQNVRSPYSKFGYGLLNDNATASQRQMGGVGYAMNSGRQINVMNPASYAAIDSMTFLFDMGADLTFLNQTEGDLKYSDKGGGLDYLSMQFPLGKRMGMSLSLLPYTSVGYSFGSEIDNGSSSHQGTGGLNQLNLGLSGRIWRGLTVGANVSYLFGTIYNDAYANVSSSNSTLFESVMKVRDYHLQFGLQYSQVIARRHKATVGVVYSPSKTLLGHTWMQTYDNISASYPTIDTLYYMSLKGKYGLPDTWGAGISYEYEGRIFAEADFTYQPWSKAKYTATEYMSETRLADRYRAGVGFSFMPRYRGRYIQRVQWRVGAYYNRDYMMVRGNHVRDYGITCGIGLPAPSGKTMVNVGFEYINRQATPQPLLKENYFNITLGINFNQTWFFQNKIR